MFDLVIKEGAVFDGYHAWEGDIGITAGVISALGKNLAGKNEIDASGKWVFPGAIDAHTHMSLPFAGAVSADDFCSGSRAAAFGGVTTIIDFLSQNGDEGLRSSFGRRLAQAQGNAVVDFSFHTCVGRFSSEVEADLDWAMQNGLTSMKVFTAYRKAGLMMADHQLFRTFKTLAAKGILPTVHAENGTVIDALTEDLADQGKIGMDSFPASRPVFTETEAVRRVIDLADAAKSPVYVVHLSCGASADLIRSSRRNGSRVLGETCPQYLLLDESRLTGENGHLFSCCPPLRPREQQEGLWKGLEEGHIQVVGTDHCPFTVQAKNTWGGDFTRLPMGLPGVETLVPLLIHRGLERGWSPNQMVRAFSAEPARIFGMYPRKGAILPGSDADLVLFDPRKKTTISRFSLHMNLDYSIYDGLEVAGWPAVTISRGEVLVKDGFFVGHKGHGKLVPRGPSSAFPR